jgi:hypothetical protein
MINIVVASSGARHIVRTFPRYSVTATLKYRKNVGHQVWTFFYHIDQRSPRGHFCREIQTSYFEKKIGGKFKFRKIGGKFKFWREISVFSKNR